MIVNRQQLLAMAPIRSMLTTKHREFGVSHGLTEAGYDIRLKQKIAFYVENGEPEICVTDGENRSWKKGRFTIASSIEEFSMPDFLVGVVHDKSTFARTGLSVFNTVLEPGWAGGLTLELVYHGDKDLVIEAGSGIAQILFHQIMAPSKYDGKYQNQSSDPVEAIFTNT